MPAAGSPELKLVEIPTPEYDIMNDDYFLDLLDYTQRLGYDSSGLTTSPENEQEPDSGRKIPYPIHLDENDVFPVD